MTDVNFERVGATGCAHISYSDDSINAIHSHSQPYYSIGSLYLYLSDGSGDSDRRRSLVPTFVHRTRKFCTIALSACERQESVLYNDNEIHNKSRFCFGAKVNFVVLCSARWERRGERRPMEIELFAVLHVFSLTWQCIWRASMAVQHAIGTFPSWQIRFSPFIDVHWRCMARSESVSPTSFFILRKM